MMIEEKKTIEDNFDRMREVIKNTWLPIKEDDAVVGETRLREGAVFRIATALTNEGFLLERKGKWVYPSYAPNGGSYVMKGCSLCGYKPSYNEELWHENPYSNYCPNCGARMMEE